MNDFNLSAVINQCEFDFDKVSSIHYESEQKPYDTAIITFTDTQLRARVTDDVENHVFLFSIFWWAEPDDPIYTDGCMESVQGDSHRHPPVRSPLCITDTRGRDSSPAHTQPKGQHQ